MLTMLQTYIVSRLTPKSVPLNYQASRMDYLIHDEVLVLVQGYYEFVVGIFNMPEISLY